MAGIHHSFDIDLAVEYGRDCALIIHHFQHWIRLNQRRKKNFRDGRTWTFQTVQEIADNFPYLTIEEVRSILFRLCEGKGRKSKTEIGFEPVLIKGNFNRTRFDQTIWYAFVDEEKFLNSKNVYEREISQMESGALPDPILPPPTPIPDTKQDISKDPPPLGSVSDDPFSDWKKRKISSGFKIEDVELAIQRLAQRPPNSVNNVEGYLDKVLTSVLQKKAISESPEYRPPEIAPKVEETVYERFARERAAEDEKNRQRAVVEPRNRQIASCLPESPDYEIQEKGVRLYGDQWGEYGWLLNYRDLDFDEILQKYIGQNAEI